MREPILKAVAMPPRVFWAPMVPAVANLIVQAPIMLMFIAMQVNPLVFMGTIVLVHIIIVIYSVREPHLSNMMRSWGMNGPAVTKTVYRVRGNKMAP